MGEHRQRAATPLTRRRFLWRGCGIAIVGAVAPLLGGCGGQRIAATPTDAPVVPGTATKRPDPSLSPRGTAAVPSATATAARPSPTPSLAVATPSSQGTPLSPIAASPAVRVAGSANSPTVVVQARIAGAARPLLPYFLGFNDKVVQVPPWQDQRFLGAVAALGPGTVRYPPGTWGNYWDWKTGWFAAGANPPGTSAQKTPDPRKLDDLRLVIAATGAVPVFILNMITATLDDQLAMLGAAQQLGLPIQLVELGNEFYISGNADFTQRFPTAQDYGREASRWAAAVKQRFPMARIAAVGSAEPPQGNGKSRTRGWNAALLPTLRDIDALTLHLYPQPGLLTGNDQLRAAQLGEGGPGPEDLQAAEAAALAAPTGVATVLGRAARAWADLAPIVGALPTGMEAWITEYNLGDPAGAVSGTWAHGLFAAALTLHFLRDPRVALACNHVIASNTGSGNGNFAAVFCSDRAFAGYANAPATTPFALSAVGAALQLLNSAMRGMVAAQELAFGPDPVAPGGDGRDAASLIGWSFAAGQQAIVLNPGPTAMRLDPGGALASATHFAQLSGPPAQRIAGAEALARRSGVVADLPALPPYSITRFGVGR